MGGSEPPTHRARVGGRGRVISARRHAPDGWPGQARPWRL